MSFPSIYDLLVYSLLAVVVYVTFSITNQLLFSPLRRIPGPWYTLVSNLPLKLHLLAGRRVYFIDDLHQRYGPIVRISPYEVAVADLESYQKIYKAGSGFQKTRWYRDFNNTPRPGILNIRDAKEHTARRKLFAKPFSKTSLRTEWERAVREKARMAVGSILKEAQQAGEADILKWWRFFATDVAGVLMFGESFGMLESGKKDYFIMVLEAVVMGCAIGLEIPGSRLLGYLPIPATKRMFFPEKYLDDYAQRAVENSRTSSVKGNVFSSISTEAAKRGSCMDDVDIRSEAQLLIIVGSDTTANTLTYLTWCVLRDSQLRRALETEVEHLPVEFTDADMEKLPLLNATIEECLRLYGAAPSSEPREVPPSGVILDGHFIPGGFVVSTQSWSLNRDPKLQTDFARQVRPMVSSGFNPYRFLKDVAESTPMSSASVISPTSAIGAFGGGAHICLGIHLAYMSLRHGLTHFLKECASLRLSPSTTPESMKPEDHFLIAPKSHKCMVSSSPHSCDLPAA